MQYLNASYTTSVWLKSNPSFEIGDVDRVHADAGTAFRSEEFISDCEQHGIKVSFAAPRHQEMNGICERAWASVRNIAFSFLVHARVGFEYYSLALEQAWKVHACLPIKNLLRDEKPISPYEYFFGEKPCIRRFRVMFCPCVINIGDGTHVKTKKPAKFLTAVTIQSEASEECMSAYQEAQPTGSFIFQRPDLF